MATASQSPKPSPERIFGVLNAFQSSAALKTAIELGIFTAIAEGADRANAIAQRVNAAERGVRILCDYLTIHGFLTKTEDRYALTQESAIFLNRRSPAYMGTLADFLASEGHKKNFDALTASVRKGGTAVAQGDNTKPNDELWVSFEDHGSVDDRLGRVHRGACRRKGRKSVQGVGHRGRTRHVWNQHCEAESERANNGGGLGAGSDSSERKCCGGRRSRSRGLPARKRV